MGRTNRNRKRKKLKDLDESQQSTNARTAMKMNSEEIYIRLARSLHRNGWQNETNLKVAEFPITGRGVYSIRSFQKDDLLISIPITSLISIVSVADDHHFRSILLQAFNNTAKSMQITAQSLLALYLLYLKHTQQTEYLATVPTLFPVPYFCEEIEIDAMIPSIRNKIIDQRAIIRSDYRCFYENFNKMRCDCCNLQYFCDIFNLPDFEWAFFAVNSRSVYFHLDKVRVKNADALNAVRLLLKDEPTLALAPFLDLFNHSCTAGTGLYVKNTTNGPLYQLYTTVPFSRYEQIFISYGALDNAKLLTEYGFFVPSNKHDFIEIQRKDIENALKSVPYRIRSMIANKNLDQSLFISRVNGISHNLRVLIYILCRASFSAGNAVEPLLDENYLKQIIYGNPNDLNVHISTDLANFATDLIAVKVKELRQQCAFFSERQLKGTLTNRAEIYWNYLKESIQWLESVKLGNS